MKRILFYLLFATIFAGNAYAYSGATELTIVQSKLFESFTQSHNKRYLEKEKNINQYIESEKYNEAFRLCNELWKDASENNSSYWRGTSLYYKGVIKYQMYEDKVALAYLQELEKKYERTYLKDKTNRVNVFSQIGKIYKSLSVYPKALDYFERSLEYERYSASSETIFLVYLNMGVIYSEQRDFRNAKECYLKCTHISIVNGESLLLTVYNNLGADAFEQGDFAEAIRWFVKSLNVCDKLHDLENMSFAYNNIGAIYTKGLKNNAKALEFYKKSLDIERKTRNKKGIAFELSNIGSLYSTKGDVKNAKKFYEEAYELYKEIDEKSGLTSLLLNLGDLYTKGKDYSTAIQYYEQAVGIKEKSGSKGSLSKVQYKIGKFYLDQGKYKEAYTYLTEALQNDKMSKDKDLESRIYNELSKVCVAQSNYSKAYEYTLLFSQTKDSLYNTSVSAQIIDIQEKYEKSKMAQKVQMQNLEIKSKSLQRNAMIAILLLSVVAFCGFVYFVRQKRKNEKLLYEKNNAIKDSEIRHLMQESELRSMASMVEGQEQERKRISRDLHDRVGSMLALIKLNLSSCDYESAEMKKNLELVEQTYQEVRSISHNLYSGIVSTLGLKVALQELKKSIENKSAISFNLTYFDDVPTFTKKQEDVVYRVVQELVTNTLKYADAKNLDIQINSDENGDIAVMVEDDGRGFDPQKKSEGIGFANIRYRLSTIDANFDVSASLGHGACFTLNIPHKEKNQTYEYFNC